MSHTVFIGDEISAAAYRLAGAKVYTPAAEDMEQTFRQARHSTPLLLITAEYAGLLPTTLLNDALLTLEPLTLVVPDVQQRHMPVDLSAFMSQYLGVQ